MKPKYKEIAKKDLFELLTNNCEIKINKEVAKKDRQIEVGLAQLRISHLIFS